jgi:hypothetical protein
MRGDGCGAVLPTTIRTRFRSDWELTSPRPDNGRSAARTALGPHREEAPSDARRPYSGEGGEGPQSSGGGRRPPPRPRPSPGPPARSRARPSTWSPTRSRPAAKLMNSRSRRSSPTGFPVAREIRSTRPAPPSAPRRSRGEGAPAPGGPADRPGRPRPSRRHRRADLPQQSVGRVTPSGEVSRFTDCMDFRQDFSEATGIVSGPGGDLWFSTRWRRRRSGGTRGRRRRRRRRLWPRHALLGLDRAEQLVVQVQFELDGAPDR